jgi:hypothetical protein
MVEAETRWWQEIKKQTRAMFVEHHKYFLNYEWTSHKSAEA